MDDYASLCGDRDIKNIFQVLSRRHKNNVVLLDGGDGTSWQIVAEVLHRMASGKVPEQFRSWLVVTLDYETLMTGISVSELKNFEPQQENPLEKRFREYCSTLYRGESRILLLVEDLPRLLRADMDTFPVDLANILVSLLAQDLLRVLATTTVERYRHFIQPDTAVNRRFQSLPCLI